MNDPLTLPRDAWWMAVRYGRGRATYADYIARTILRAVWPHLSAGERDNERRELREFLRLAAPHHDAPIMCGSAAHWRLLYEAMDDDKLPAELPGTPVFDDWGAYR
ncbi:MAG: hypothetical protein Q4F65_12575 [Propionibacteriaceae bacterium]|nr:hypothetical protein [Propionibacteriaceae bacterium]